MSLASRAMACVCRLSDRVEDLEASASGVVFLEEVNGYIGGGPTNLDGVSTVGVTVPKLYFFDHTTDGVVGYLLVASTQATASPNWIRPVDYDGALNQKVFRSVL